ncbi:MAG: hypothetical protein WC509_02080 [Candidatus Izemoplasmatales bacterium]
MRGFIACSNGKDYIINLEDKSRTISQLDLSTRRTFTFIFNSPKEAANQFDLWIQRSELRLPLVFFVRLNATPNLMKAAVERLGYPFPAVHEIKRFVQYKRFEDGDGVIMKPMDDIDKVNIPEITLDFLDRIIHGPVMIRKTPQLVGGML